MISHLFYLIRKGFRDPIAGIYYILGHLFRENPSLSQSMRSLSDNGMYLTVVRKALYNENVFKTFKLHPYYRRIIDTNDDLGLRCFQVSRYMQDTEFKISTAIKDFDAIGGPRVVNFSGELSLSANMLRYIYFAEMIKDLFGEMKGFNICEIGCGNGGQLVALDQMTEFDNYLLMDLPDVLALTSKCLERTILKNRFSISTLNTFNTNIDIDIVISNYAFSELPRPLQDIYVRKVLSKSKRGFMAMNTGSEHFSYLQAHIPNLEKMNEYPLSNPGNYIVYWGIN